MKDTNPQVRGPQQTPSRRKQEETWSRRIREKLQEAQKEVLNTETEPAQRWRGRGLPALGVAGTETLPPAWALGLRARWAEVTKPGHQRQRERQARVLAAQAVGWGLSGGRGAEPWLWLSGADTGPQATWSRQRDGLTARPVCHASFRAGNCELRSR